MGFRSKIVSGTVSRTMDAVSDFVSAGFGTPDAALIWVTGAQDTAGTQASALLSFGMFDGVSQVCSGLASLDGADPTQTNRWQSLTSAARLVSVSTTKVDAAASFINNGVRLTTIAGDAGGTYQVVVLLLKGLKNVKLGVVPSLATSAADINTVGFKPSVLFSSFSGLDGETNANNGFISFGVAHCNTSNVITQHTISTASDNGLGTAQTYGRADNARIGYLQASGETARNVTVSAFDSAGFSIATSVSATNQDFFYLAIELADPDQFYLGFSSASTSTGAQALSGFGFQPNTIGLLGLGVPTLNTATTSGETAIFVGLADEDEEEFSVVYGDERISAVADTFVAHHAGQIVTYPLDTGVIDAVATLTSYDADGVTLNWSDAAGAARKFITYAFGAGPALVRHYWVVYPAGDEPPSGPEIVAGQRAGGFAAPAYGDVRDPDAAGTVYALPIAEGLTEGTAYRTAVVPFDGTSYGTVAFSAEPWSTESVGTIGFITNALSAVLGSLPQGTQSVPAGIEDGSSVVTGSSAAAVQIHGGFLDDGVAASTGSGLAGSQSQASVIENTSVGAVGSPLAGTAVQTGSIENAASQVTGSQAGAYSEPAPTAQNASSSTSASVPAGTQVLNGAVENAESATQGSSVSPGTAFGTIEDSSSAVQGTTVLGAHTQVAFITNSASLVLASQPAGVQTVSAEIEDSVTVVVGQPVFLGSETLGAAGSTVAASGASVPMGSQIQASIVPGASAGVSVTTPDGTQLQLGIVVTGVSQVLGSEPGEGESVGGPGTGIAQLPIYAQNRNLPIYAQNRVLPW